MAIITIELCRFVGCSSSSVARANANEIVDRLLGGSRTAGAKKRVVARKAH